MDTKTIVPLALIITELVSNSLKHAFPSGNTVINPHIAVRINTLSDTHFELNYADNGTWKRQEGSSFGLELIDTLSEQLDGVKNRTTDAKGKKYHFKLKMVQQL